MSSTSLGETKSVSREMWSRAIATAIVLVMVLSAFVIVQTPALASRPGTELAGATPEYMKYIQVNNFRFDPLAETPWIPSGLQYESIPANAEIYYIVQFTGPVTPAMKRALEASGAKILQYIPYNAFVVRADSADIARASALPIVRWAGVFEPAYKLSPRLAQSYDAIIQKAMDESLFGVNGATGEPAVSYNSLASKSVGPQSAQGQASFGPSATRAGPTTGSGPQASFGSSSTPIFKRIDTSSRIPITIFTFEDSRLLEVARTATALGGREVRVSPNGDGIVKADVPRAILPALARELGAMWIDRFVQPYVFNDIARWTVQSGDEETMATPIHDRGIWGTGQLVTLADTGIDYEHDAFQDPDVDIPGPDHRKVTDYYAVCDFNCDDSDNGFANHGTHTAGSVGGDDGTWHVYDGDGTGSNGSAGPHDGQAFDAFIHMQDTSNDGFGIYFDDILDLWVPAVNRSSWIHSNSWGSCCAEYISEAAITDEFIFNNQDFLVVFAAGNSGCMGCMNPFAGAKNVVAVGGTMNGPGRENMYDSSSRGPMNDGRLKPDVTAPAVSLWSAHGCDPGGECDDYWTLTGTSMATPTVAGSAALVRQYFTDGWYPTGAQEVGNGFTPSAALLKAMLVNSAVEMTGNGAYDNGWNYYPNPNQGFGRILLDNAMFFQGEARGLAVDDYRIGIGTGETIEYALAIGDGSIPVEITLVYSDWPGTPGVSPNLVNDLNLVVTAPDGTVYLGNQYVGMNPGESEPNPAGADRLNNVEGVLVITDVQAGLWTVQVVGFDIPQGPQSFALVMTGGIATERGIIQLDANSYQSSASPLIRVIDTGLNVDPNAPDTVVITMTSDTEPTGEPVTLTETGDASSVFAGSINLALGAPDADGTLQVTNGDTVTAEYIDADDGLGGTDVPVQDTATVDDSAPLITGVAATDLRFNRATIVWTTDEPASSAVHYALDPGPPSSTVSEARRVTSHSMDLPNLLENTTYVFSVESTDEAGNMALDDNGGAYYTFTTLPKPPTAPPDAEWPTFHNNLPRQGLSPSNFLPPIDLQWEDGPHNLQFWNGPIVSEGILFSAPLDGTLRARDPFTGEVIWERTLGGQNYYTPTMTANEGVLYAPFYGGSGGTLYALDMFTGETIWSVSDESGLDFNARIQMGYADGLVFGTDWSGKAYALNAADGSVEWTFQLDQITISGAAINAGIAYFSTVGGTIYALDEFTGSEVWSVSLDNTVTPTPLYAQDNIYVGTYSGTMYALDASTGEEVWSTGGFSLIDVSTPAYDGASIYFGTFGNQYVALDATDGTVLWRTSVGGPIGTSPAYANGYVYGTSWDGRLYTFDAVDGSIDDQETLRAFGSTSFPAVWDGWVFVEDYEGYIFGFFGQLPVGVSVTPGRQSRDSVPDAEVDHRVTVKNIGISGPDTFDAEVTLGALGWTTELFQADGTTPLQDTDADGMPDTGSLATGASVDVIIRVTVPADVLPGDSDTARATFTSSNDLTRSKVGQVTTTVPPPGVTVGPRAYFTPLPGDTVSAAMQVSNTGGFPDTIDVVAESSLDWAVRLYKADGTTPLSDSDGDGIPDVGLVPGLQAVTIVVENDVPADAPDDTFQRVAVTGTSSLNESASGTAYLVVELIPPPDEQWPTFHNNKRRHGQSPSPHGPPISELWRSGSQTQSLWTGLVVADNVLYGTSLDGYLRARDPFSGEVLWEKQIGDTFYYTGTPTVNDGVVYTTGYGFYDGDPDPFCPNDAPFFGSCGYVYAFDAETGNEIWRVGPNETHLNFNARVAMAYSNGLVIGAAWNDFSNGQVYALDAETGELAWLFNADGLPFGGGAASAGLIYYGTLTGWMYALDDLTGNLVWAERLPSTITSVPLVAQGMIIAGTYSGTMHALDANTGSEVWSTGGFSLIDVSTPATDGSAIYFGTFGSQYVALDLGTGTVLWRTSIGGPVASSVALANGYMYGTSWDGRLRTLDTTDGQIVDTETLGAFASTSSPAIQRGWIWIEDYFGALYAFGGAGAGELRMLVVSPDQAQVEVGKALLFTAHGIDAFDNPIPAGVVTWDTGGLGTIFPIDDHTAFYIAGTVAGEDFVEATASEFIGTATVTVLPGELDGVEVAMLDLEGNRLEGPVSLEAGAQRTFVAVATDRYGNPIEDVDFQWGVTGSIGTISPAGVFTASTTVGIGFVTATHAGRTGRQPVTIVPGPAARVDINVPSTSLEVDSHTVIVATVRDVYDNANPDGVVRWATTGTGGIVVLIPDGRSMLYNAPTTTSPASVQLTATIGSGASAISQTITLTIVAGPTDRIQVAMLVDGNPFENPVSIPAGSQRTFVADATDRFGNPIEATFVWGATGNIGTISSAGVFTASTTPGTGFVSATYAGVTGRQPVTVVPAAPATVDIELPSTSVAVDSQTVVVATVRDVYDNANPDGIVRWTTTGAGTILELTPDGRAILYNAPITTTPASVQLTATIGTGASAVSRTITLAIVAGPPVGIAIDAPATTVAVGGILDFDAVVTDQFGNAVAGATVAWETTAGSINQQGVFTAPSQPGLVVITASTAGRESFVVVDVTSGALEQFSRQATSATSLGFLVAALVAVGAGVFVFFRYREARRELEEVRKRGGGPGEP